MNKTQNQRGKCTSFLQLIASDFSNAVLNITRFGILRETCKTKFACCCIDY